MTVCGHNNGGVMMTPGKICKYCGIDVPEFDVCVGCIMILGVLAYESGVYNKEDVTKMRKFLLSKHINFDPPMANRG